MKRILYVCSFAVSLLFAGCGGSHGSQELTGLRFIADDIEVGESVRVEADVESGTDGFGDPESVSVFLNVSRFLSVDEDSFRIFEGGDDDTDVIFPESVQRCPDGRTLVSLRFSRDDIRDAGSNGSFKMKFNVIGEMSTGTAVVDGSAGELESFSCREDFEAESSDSVIIR
jgi:hypothetical protein